MLASNGYVGTALPGREVDPVEDIAVYDRLPAGVRAVLADMPMDVVAASVEELAGRLGARTVEVLLLPVLRANQEAECRRLNEEACAL